MKQNPSREARSSLFLQPPVFRTEKRRGEAGVVVSGLLFFLGLFGTVWGFVSCFSLPVSLPVLAGWAAILCLLLTVGHRWRFADILLFLLSAALCLFLWRFQEEIVQGFLLTVNCITRAYTENSAYQFPTFLTDDLTGPQQERCASLFVGACMVPAAGALSWAVLRLRSFFLSFLFTFPFLFSALLFTISPAPGATACLLLFWSAVALLSPKVRSAASRRRAPRERQRLPAASLLLIGLTAGLLLALSLAVPAATYVRPQGADDFRVSLETAAQELSALARGAAAFSGSRDEAVLEGGGPGFSGQTVLMVQSSEAAELRLRGFTGTVYDGCSWKQLPDDAYHAIEEELGGPYPQNLAGLLAEPFASPIDVTVRNVGGDRRIVYSPYLFVTDPAELSGVTPVHDAFLRGDLLTAPAEYTLRCFDLSRIPMPGEHWIAADFYREKAEQGNDWMLSPADTWYSLYPCVGDQASLDIVEQYYRTPDAQALLRELPEPIRSYMEQELAYSAFVYDTCLDVPEELRTRLVETYSTGQILTFTEFLAWVEQIISTSGRYTLSAPQTPQGEDFAEYFLFESREGYCVHFASSAVMLLRSFGVPARYVEGFVVSEEELAAAGPDGWVAVPDTRSHAWAEAYCPGLGWVPVEATPGSGVEQILEQDEPEAPVSEPESEPSSPEPVSSEQQPSRPASSESQQVPPALSSAPGQGGADGGSQAVWRVLLALLGCVLALGLVILFFALRRSLREKRFSRLPANRAVTLLYRRALCAVRFGAAMDPRLRELAEKAKFSRGGVSGEERDEARRLVSSLFAATKRELPLWKRLLFLLYTL